MPARMEKPAARTSAGTDRRRGGTNQKSATAVTIASCTIAVPAVGSVFPRISSIGETRSCSGVPTSHSHTTAIAVRSRLVRRTTIPTTGRTRSVNGERTRGGGRPAYEDALVGFLTAAPNDGHVCTMSRAAHMTTAPRLSSLPVEFAASLRRPDGSPGDR